MEPAHYSEPNNNSVGNGTYDYTPPLAQFAKDFLKPSGIISLIAATFGIVFNILNIIVLSHAKMRNAVNLLLTLMAASQLSLLVLFVPQVIIFNLQHNPDSIPMFHTSSIHKARYMLLYTDASVFFHLSAAWLLITTACFRFIFVQLPLRSGQLCTYRRAIIAGTCTVLGCLVMSVPNFMLNSIQEHSCNTEPHELMCGRNITYYIVQPGRYPEEFGWFNFWLYAILGKFLPVILLLIFTIFLVKVLRKANQRKRRLVSDAGIGHQLRSPRSSTSEHSQTARMLLAVVVLSFTIEFPHGLLIVYAVITNDFETYSNLGELIDLATVISFSLNLILYSAMSRQYRRLFIDIFIRQLATKFSITKHRAKYKKCSCSGTSHNAVCVPPMSETCALSVAHDTHTTHSLLHSDDSFLHEGNTKQSEESKLNGNVH